jgi:hypothetical protein
MESFEICWRRIEKFICTDGVRNEEVLYKAKSEELSYTIKKGKAN